MMEVSRIPGWGSDLYQRPGVPREKTRENGASPHERHWLELVRQVPEVRIHQTIERPHITPVFGSTAPPRGLSGVLRDYAYRYSEDKMRHWYLLVLADRVDMIEGWIEDLRAGKKPALLPSMEFRTLNKVRMGRIDPFWLGVGAAAGAGFLYLVAKRFASRRNPA